MKVLPAALLTLDYGINVAATVPKWK